MLNIDRLNRIEGSGRPLERPFAAVAATDFEEVLLDLEVTRVSEVIRADWPAERHGEGLAQGQAESDPDLERQTEPEAALDCADPWLREADATPELGLAEPESAAASANLCAECRGDPPCLGDALRPGCDFERPPHRTRVTRHPHPAIARRNRPLSRESNESGASGAIGAGPGPRSCVADAPTTVTRRLVDGPCAWASCLTTTRPGWDRCRREPARSGTGRPWRAGPCSEQRPRSDQLPPGVTSTVPFSKFSPFVSTSARDWSASSAIVASYASGVGSFLMMPAPFDTRTVWL